MRNGLFVNLHVHSEYSQLDGLIKFQSYVRKAKEKGFRYAAITDHGAVDGAIKFQQVCEAEGIIPVIGCELYIIPDCNDPQNKEIKSKHILVFVKNQEGWTNLLKLLSYANLEGFYRKPRIDFPSLIKHHEGLIISTACVDSFLLLPGGEEFLTGLWKAKHEQDVYLEIMPHNTEQQKSINQLCFRLYDRYGIPFIATNDCHYLEKEDAKAHEVLLAIQRQAKWDDPKRWKFDPAYEIWLKDADEMMRAFKDQVCIPEPFYTAAMRNTLKIAEACADFRMEKKEMSLPFTGTSTSIEEEEDKLYELIVDGFSSRFNISLQDAKSKKEWDVYRDRLTHEFDVICSKGFVRYFLIVHDLVQWCKKNDIMVGPGRGSAGASAILYVLGVTNLDPIKYDLPFSRFINEERIDFPDIDLDFEDRKREQVKQYLARKYGKYNVAAISTFLTMKSRGVIRDVSRVFNVPLKDVDAFAKAIDVDIQEALKHPVGKVFKKTYPEIVELALKLENTIRGGGVHAAGLIISSEDLREGTRCNLVSKSKEIAVNWGMEECEHQGLMKLDVLGLNALTILNEARKLIRSNYNVDIIFESIPLNDKEVFKELSSGHTAGIFQFTTHPMTKLAMEMGIGSFQNMSDAVALVRPGPQQSGMTDEFIKRKHGARWKKKHPIYEEVTKNTYGLIVYQEDVMNVVHKVAGLSYPIADKIRKIIGKKREAKDFEQFKDTFIKGCIEQKTLSQVEAEEFWEGMQAHARYSFNMAHSCGYAMIGYWMAWLKCHYPQEFLCSSLTYGGDSNKSDLVKEARRLGWQVVPPKVGISKALEWTISEGKMYVPFVEIKGLGESGANDAAGQEPVKFAKKGFFRIKNVELKKVKGKIKSILDDIHAYEPDTPFSSEIQHYFDFDMTGDPSASYPKLFKLLEDNRKTGQIEQALVGDIELKLGREVRPFRLNRKLNDCHDCQLRGECDGPVHPSPSRNNIMLAGEAPGFEENKEGKGFIGRVAVDMLWPTMAKFKLTRDMFHISNVVKCFPSQTRTPTIEHIQACEKWLDEEIEWVKPFIILAFGNACVYKFKRQESGITKLSTTSPMEWNEKYGCWIFWSVHPSYALRRPQAKGEFEDAIRLFSEKLESIGGI